MHRGVSLGDRGTQLLPGALGNSDYEPGASGSLSSGSEYSLRRLDRLSRPYHYQPPYVEDYESELDEELWRQQEELEGRNGILPRDLYEAYGLGEGLIDQRRRRGLL